MLRSVVVVRAGMGREHQDRVMKCTSGFVFRYTGTQQMGRVSGWVRSMPGTETRIGPRSHASPSGGAFSNQQHRHKHVLKACYKFIVIITPQVWQSHKEYTCNIQGAVCYYKYLVFASPIQLLL